MAAIPVVSLVAVLAAAAPVSELLIDDFAAGDGRSRLGTEWRFVSDGVMGGRSTGRLDWDEIRGRRALCLRGEVSLANDGGFIQATLDLAPSGTLDGRDWSGIRLLVQGNGERYNLHLKTLDLRLPWQSYRSTFTAEPDWQDVHLPFAGFVAHRVQTPLDVRRLRRLALVAIGRAFEAELCVAEIGLYRER